MENLIKKLKHQPSSSPSSLGIEIWTSQVAQLCLLTSIPVTLNYQKQLQFGGTKSNYIFIKMLECGGSPDWFDVEWPSFITIYDSKVPKT